MLCDNGFFLKGTPLLTCTDDCGIEYFENDCTGIPLCDTWGANTAANPECSECEPTCLNCADDVSCTECPPGEFLVDLTGLGTPITCGVCPSSFWGDPVTKTCTACIDSNCETCSNLGNDCDICDTTTPYYLYPPDQGTAADCVADCTITASYPGYTDDTTTG